jgi:hypothetical protein
MELFCGRAGGWSTPNWPCCVAVVGSVRMGADGMPCFCHAALASASVDVGRVAALYVACGGMRTGVALRLANMCPGSGTPA